MNRQDRRFYDSFMLIVGIFVGLILGVIFMKAFTGGSNAAAMNAHPSAETMIEGRRTEVVNFVPPNSGRLNFGSDKIPSTLHLALIKTL
ncbi:MAG: hypothetical protein VX690_02380 [Pseudomonadota bacterium]|nr:hypothetical protein [Pseudomonadota bacterium]